MALKINSAQSSLLQSLDKSNQALSDSLQRLATGRTINKAADNGAGLLIADMLASQASGLGQSIRNAGDALAITQVADGALSAGAEIVGRIRTLALQAAQDGQSAESRQALQAEIDGSLAALDDIAKNTAYNGQKLLTGTFTDKTYPVGAQSGESITLGIGGATAEQLGGLADINVLTREGAEQAIAAADEALGRINGNRANLGAAGNGLRSTINNLSATRINLEAARSQIADTDFAEESIVLARMKVLTKAQSFAAAQAGKIDKNNLMNLLQG